MSVLSKLNWAEVREHYDLRHSIHKRLLTLLEAGKRLEFVELLIGLSDPNGNYSAVEHGLGPLILSENLNPIDRIWNLAWEFREVESAHEVPKIIRDAGLSYLQIGVGSEASCMLNPEVCWVCNSRTIWTQLVVKHADDFNKADIELRLYRDADTNSEMAYPIWTAIHGELATSMTRIAEEGATLARKTGVVPGPKTVSFPQACVTADQVSW